MKTEDEILLKLIQGKDRRAYTLLFEKYYKTLTNQASYILKDKMEAEDQVQNLFIGIIDGKIGININSCLKAYLKTCIYHKCLMVISRDKRVKRHIDLYAVSFNREITYDYFHKAETQQCMDDLLKELPVQRLEACKLVYLQQKKYKEAAAEMGITINSVKTHLRLANKGLRRQFIGSREQVKSLLYA